jgi:hypothetical protein
VKFQGAVFPDAPRLSVNMVEPKSEIKKETSSPKSKRKKSPPSINDTARCGVRYRKKLPPLRTCRRVSK